MTRDELVKLLMYWPPDAEVQFKGEHRQFNSSDIEDGWITFDSIHGVRCEPCDMGVIYILGQGE